jgi:hypothetical protein
MLIIPSYWGFPTGPVRHQCVRVLPISRDGDEVAAPGVELITASVSIFLPPCVLFLGTIELLVRGKC